MGKKKQKTNNFLNEQVGILAALLGALFAFLAVIISGASFFSSQGLSWSSISLLVFITSCTFWLIALISPQRKTHLNWLKEERLSSGYRKHIRPWLDKVDSLFSKDIDREKQPLAYYWSADLLGFTLFIAIAYPILSLLMQWLTSGNAVTIGSIEVFKGIMPWQKIFVVIILLFSIYQFFYLNKKKSDKHLINYAYSMFIGVTSLFGVISFGLTANWIMLLTPPLTLIILFIAYITIKLALRLFHINNNYMSAYELGIIIIPPVIFVFLLGTSIIEDARGGNIISIMGIDAGMFSVAGMMSIVLMIAATAANKVINAFMAGSVIGLIFLFASGITLSPLTPSMDVMIFIGMTIVISLPTIILIQLPNFLLHNKPLRLILLVIFYLILLLCSVVFGLLTNDSYRSFLVIIGFLPLINALFDYLSIGLTRYLLNNSLENNHPVMYGIVDAVLAILIFFTLKLGLVALFILLQDTDGKSLLELLGQQGLFNAIRQSPEDYIWLYFTLFSTLIPTLLHLNIACFSIIASHFKALTRFIQTLADWLKKPSEAYLKSSVGFILLCLFTTFFIVTPIWVFSHLWQLIIINHGTIMDVTLNLAENWATYLQNWKAQL